MSDCSCNVLENILSDAPIGFFMSTPEGRFLAANQAMAGLLGYGNPDELIRSVTDIASQVYRHPGQRNEFIKAFESNGSIINQEFELVRRDGSVFVAESSTRAVKNQAGEVVHYQGFISDVTDRKEAEGKARESQALMKSILSGLSQAVWSLSYPGYEPVFFSPMLEKIYGRPVSAFEDDPMLWNKVVHPEDRQNVQEILDALLDQGSFSRECRIVLPDGSIKWILDHSRLVLDDYGQPSRIDGIVSDITRLKQTELELRETRSELNTILDSVPVMIWHKDIKGRYVHANKLFCETVNISGEKLKGLTDYQIHPSQLAEKYLQDDIQVFESRRPLYNMTEMHRKSSGETGWSLTHKIPVFDEQGLVSGVIGFALDITELKNTEQALKQSEANKQILLDNIRTQVWYLTSETTYGAVNKAHAEFFGVSPEDLAFSSLNEIMPPCQVEVCREGNQQVFSTGRPVRTEEWVSNASGEKRLLSIVKWPKKNSSGQVEYVVCSAEDITEQKKTQDKLAERDRLLTKLSMQVPGVIYQFLIRPDGSGCFPFASRGIWDIYEVTPEQVRNDASLVYKRLHQDDYERVVESIQTSLETLCIWEDEYRVVLPSRGLRWLKGHARPEKQPDGSTIWHGYLVDNTEKKFIEQDLRQAKENAEKANKAKSDFLANLSHEIRTPMSGIMGALEMLSAQNMDAESRRILDMTLDSASSLRQIIDDILDLSKVEAGRMDIIEAPFVLAQLLQKVMDLYMFQAREKNIQLLLDIHPCCPDMLVGDEHRLTQILRNLVNNAIKFTSQGKVVLRARPGELRNSSLEMIFEVEDTGVGISSDFLPRLFENFSQEDTSYAKKAQGTGLGLAICSSLLRLMNGKIDVRSTYGRGSVFMVRIPFHLPDKNNFQQIPGSFGSFPSEKKSKARAPLASMNILVVEDVIVNQEYIRFILERKGHLVDVAVNGREAVDKFQKGDYHLILMDIQMSEMDGLEATRLIRLLEEQAGNSVPAGDAGPDQDKAWSLSLNKDRQRAEARGREHGFSGRIPIIALTAYAMPAEKEKFLSSGMDGYVTKPINEQELVQEINKVIWSHGGWSAQENPGSRIKKPELDHMEVINFSDVKKRYQDDLQFWKRIFSSFVNTELTTYIQGLEQALAAENARDLGAVAHKLKSALGIVGAQRAGYLADEIDQHIKQNKSEPAFQLAKDLIAELGLVQDFKC